MFLRDSGEEEGGVERRGEGRGERGEGEGGGEGEGEGEGGEKGERRGREGWETIRLMSTMAASQMPYKLTAMV